MAAPAARANEIVSVHVARAGVLGILPAQGLLMRSGLATAPSHGAEPGTLLRLHGVPVCTVLNPLLLPRPGC